MRVLIVEDDVEAGAFLARGLVNAGYDVEVVLDGLDGLDRCAAVSYDVVVVDRLLPHLDGLSMVEQLRRRGQDMPVLFVTAVADVDERVKGLRAGGDDYLTKPYAFAEVVARIEVLLRRRQRQEDPPSTLLRVADLEMDLLKRTVIRGGKPIALHPREFSLLEFFLRHVGQVVTRSMLLEAVWNYRFDPQTNVIDVHISRLRRKIEADYPCPLIRTVRGAGYTLDAGKPA
ncbi:response regulator transcription factor [Telmatospirillum sp.]|uniref:response regulator transcription factor n=1 Tax=Telmatospirillum sp. TaxID=2079197 RepID=UPI002843C249|nr:response regulator transcription factor [Telmatospirillum sp.]MDR3436879.1 response regulator transcription factor [Telmatospirillum sp.]